MAAKTEAKEAKEASAPSAPEAAAAGAPASAGGSKLKALLPALAAIVLAPAASWAVAQFVLVPRLQKQLATPPAAEGHAAAEPAPGGGGHGKEGREGGEANTYEFSNIVVNLSGTMGTRYLKTSFLVTGADRGLKALFETGKPRLTDVTLSVLSSLTLADLEEPGSKNLLREKLVGAYNQTLGRRVVEQVYFSDFVIQ